MQCRSPFLLFSLSLTSCAAILALSGCGSAVVSSANLSGSTGNAPAVVAVGAQANGVAPNRWQYVQFNEAMNPSTINSQTFVVADSSGRPAPGTVIYNANFEIAGFQPNPALAENSTYTLTVTTGAASAQGVHMAAPYTSQFTTRATMDESPIYVKNVTPFPDASCVSPTTPIVITLNEGADVNTINSSNIMTTGPDGAPIQAKIWYNPTTATVTLTPTAPLPSGSITVYVNNVADAAGVKMTSPFMWSFLTTCGGGSSPTTQYMAQLFGPSAMYGQVTIDTNGNTTVQLNGAGSGSTYTVQFCPAFSAGYYTAPSCFTVTTISTDSSGDASSTVKFPKSGKWAGDFYVNNSAGKTAYQTFVPQQGNNVTYMSILLPETMTNGGVVTNLSSQTPLTSGTVSYSNGSLKITMTGAEPNTTYDISESETRYLGSSGTYVLGTFSTDAMGNAAASTTLKNGSGGDMFETGPQGPGAGFIGGFSVP